MTVLAIAPLPVLLFVAGAAILATGCGVEVDIEVGGDTTRRTEREVVPLDDIARIDVSTDNGQVDIVGADVDEIDVGVVIREADEGDADYRLDVDDGVLDLDGECDSSLLDPCSVGFVMTIPHDLSVDVDTDNGRVVLERLAGEIDVHTNNGEITATELTSADVRARTDNGRIRVVFDVAPDLVDVRTGNGAIDVIVPDDGTEYTVDADSGNGSVDIDVERAPDDGADAAPRIVAMSGNGSIDIDTRR